MQGHWSYTYTVRRPEIQGQVVETKTTLTQRDYLNMLSQKEPNHVTVFKTRRCFLLNDQYFQLDIYKDPCHPRSVPPPPKGYFLSFIMNAMLMYMNPT